MKFNSNGLSSPTDFSSIEFSMPRWDNGPTALRSPRPSTKKPSSRSEHRERSRQDSKLSGARSSQASSRTSSLAESAKTQHQPASSSIPLAHKDPPRPDRWVTEEIDLAEVLPPIAPSPSKIGARSRSTPSVPSLGLFPHIRAGSPPSYSAAPPPVPPKAPSPKPPQAPLPISSQATGPPKPERPPPTVPPKAAPSQQPNVPDESKQACKCRTAPGSPTREDTSLSSQVDDLSSESLRGLVNHMQALCGRLEDVLDERQKHAVECS